MIFTKPCFKYKTTDKLEKKNGTLNRMQKVSLRSLKWIH